MNDPARKATSALLVFAGLVAPIQAQTAQQRFHQTHRAMGTEFSIDLYANSEVAAGQAMTIAFDEIDRLEELLSNYRSSSELSRISRDAGAGPVTTDPETFRFLERSFFWSRVSDGAFDITVGPLLRAWGFFFHTGRVPSAGEIESLGDRVGWQKVQLDAAMRTVTFTTHAPMELDPGSIGKGFAVDRVANVLRARGVSSAFISAGGSTLYAIGTIPGMEGWPVEIPDPRHQGRVASRVLLKDMSLSTGACTEKFFIQDGHRYCHIFDPRTRRPVEAMLQTTVMDPSATDSDALSTVAFVLQADASSRLLDGMKATQALIFGQSVSNSGCLAIHWAGTPCSDKSPLPEKESKP